MACQRASVLEEKNEMKEAGDKTAGEQNGIWLPSRLSKAEWYFTAILAVYNLFILICTAISAEIDLNYNLCINLCWDKAEL